MAKNNLKTDFWILSIEKPALGTPSVSGIFNFYAVHIPDNLVDAHANYGHTNYRLGWALSGKQNKDQLKTHSQNKPAGGSFVCMGYFVLEELGSWKLSCPGWSDDRNEVRWDVR